MNVQHGQGPTKLEDLSREDLLTIAKAARETCKWIGHRDTFMNTMANRLEELRDVIQTVTGYEIEEYT